jgi:hypothetical protein
MPRLKLARPRVGKNGKTRRTAARPVAGIRSRKLKSHAKGAAVDFGQTGRHATVVLFARFMLWAALFAVPLWALILAVDVLSGWPLWLRLPVAFAGMGGIVGVLLLAGFLLGVPEIDMGVAFLAGKLTRRGRDLDVDFRHLLVGQWRERLCRRLRAFMTLRLPEPTRPDQLPCVLTDADSARTVAKEFRASPTLPGLYVGGGPAITGDELEEASEMALRGKVDLLGSGPIELGCPIDWHKDYISGYTWPRLSHWRLKVRELPGGVDGRFPWELSRCQHWTHLAAARKDWQTASDELLEQFRDFVAANPPGVGITYGRTRDVAIRSVSWLAAFRTVADWLIDRDIEHLCVEMNAAGEFICGNLERSTVGLNPSEYIVNLLGLYAISTMFPSLAHAGAWYRFSGGELTAELERQFDFEGMLREGSPAYARLVIECYLFAYQLGRAATDPRVDDWRDRLERALEALTATMLPNGELPRLGDDGAGRLLVPPGETETDIRYLVQVGVVLFERADWKARAGTEPRPGLDFWLGREGVEKYAALATQTDRAALRVFDAAGVAVRRTPGTFLIVQGGRRERFAPRAHLHNDLTSFEFFADGERWILDSGSFEFDRQPTWRNRFRSTGAHNVVQVDDAEQNRYDARWLFYLAPDARPRPLKWAGRQIVAGYRLPGGAPYREATRRFECSGDGRLIEVYDRVEGTGRHDVVLGLNLARCPFTYMAPDLLHFRSQEGHLLLYIPSANGFVTTVKDGWSAPRFGMRERCFRVAAVGVVDLPVELHWRFAAVEIGDDLETWATRLTGGQSRSRIQPARRAAAVN